MASWRVAANACPTRRYGETIESVLEAIAAMRADGLDPANARPASAGGCGTQCARLRALGYRAKRAGRSAASLAGIAALQPLTTAYTISLDDADAMAAKAFSARHLPLLKLKLGGDGDAERLRQVRAACPATRLIADANESWSEGLLAPLLAAAAATGVELIEQPLPADADAALAAITAWCPCVPMRPCTHVPTSIAWSAATMPSTSSSTRPAD